MDSQTEFPVEKSEDVVLDIPEESRSEEKKPNPADSDSNLDFLQEFPYVKPKAPCPEISKPAGMNPKKAPRSPQPGGHIRRRSITKPKSRFEEPVNSSHSSHALAPDQLSSSAYDESPNKKTSGASNTLLPNIDEEEEEEDDDVYKKELLHETEKRRKKVKIWLIIEWLMLILATACLIASLLVQRLQGYVIWYLEIWMWCLMMIVIFCGQLITYWFISVLVFLIEINFLFRKKVLYFVYGVQKSVQICVWLGLVLLSWSLIFNGKVVPKSLKTAIAFNYVSRVLASLFIGSDIWLAKTLLVKILASSFHMNRFFDRIQETLYHQYLLQALSGPPIMEMVEKVGPRKSSAQFSFKTIVKSKGKGKREEIEVIDIGKLHRISQEKVSAWTMRGLINVIISSGLSTISNKIDENFGEDRGKQKDKEITNEVEARAAAYKIFKRVAKPGYQYIEVEDLMRFSNDEEITYMFPLFEGALESGIIKKSALRNWVVKAYLDRKSLVHSLNDTKLAVDKLHKLLSTIVIFVIIIITLLIMGFATTKVLVLISSQILLVGFIFTNSCKTAFEAIIFVFVMHPFDVGDRCVIDGVQMIVEEMNILSTVLLQSNNAKIYYPNAVLATKPIKNFYRSPDMGDSVEFSVDISTSMERINALKASIKAYIDSKPNHWRHEHSIKVKDIMDISKIEIILYVTHTMNYQNIIKKDNRRTDLILELKRIFEDLSIQYNLLPREVQFSYVGSNPLPVAVFHDRV